MFDAEAAAEIISLCDGLSPTKRVERPLRVVEVYAYFNRSRMKPRPSWLQAVTVSQPTEIDIHLTAQAWAENDPGYLDDLMLYPYECPSPDHAMIIAAEIAKVACYRVNQGLTAEPWAVSVARLGGDLSD